MFRKLHKKIDDVKNQIADVEYQSTKYEAILFRRMEALENRMEAAEKKESGYTNNENKGLRLNHCDCRSFEYKLMKNGFHEYEYKPICLNYVSKFSKAKRIQKGILLDGIMLVGPADIDSGDWVIHKKSKKIQIIDIEPIWPPGISKSETPHHYDFCFLDGNGDINFDSYGNRDNILKIET